MLPLYLILYNNGMGCTYIKSELKNSWDNVMIRQALTTTWAWLPWDMKYCMGQQNFYSQIAKRAIWNLPISWYLHFFKSFCVAQAVFMYPWRAKFFKGNINIYLHFVAFLHIDTMQVVEILPQTRYVDGTPTLEVTPITIWYIHPPHHGYP